MGKCWTTARPIDYLGGEVVPTMRTKRVVTLAALLAVAVSAIGCSSTNSTTGSSGGKSGIPSSAFQDHTGVTSNSIRVANVSTLSLGGLFKGALVGTEAYFDMVNASGGVNGRKIDVDSTDDGFTGIGNKEGVQSAITNDFALVGGFSAQDSYGGTVLAKNLGMPEVAVAVSPTAANLPNVFSPQPLPGGWEEGPLQYFKKKFPNDIGAVGTIISDQPAGLQQWAGEAYALKKVGYKVIYVYQTPTTQTDFTANIIAMKDAGVKLLFLDQLPEIYTSAIFKDLAQQSYHPQVILGAGSYSNSLVSDSGGATNVDGAAVNQNASFYLGQDAFSIPAVDTFIKWVGIASPGFKADIFSFYGWISAELFTDALMTMPAPIHPEGRC